ncbi:angiotensin-converting enzyme-like [Amphiura filiformis]|uniref:angiotensin-converting enzyme-like n=1 Tax=Amphiura filiformis TaxID=82378 RepID=UPI003B20E221
MSGISYHGYLPKCIHQMLFALCTLVCISNAQEITNLEEARAFLEEYNRQAMMVNYETESALWNYSTNITDYNKQKRAEASLKLAEFNKRAYQNASRFDDTNFPEDVKRQLMFIKDVGVGALDDEAKIEEFNNLIPKMSGIYSTRTVCKPDNATECYSYEGGLQETMAKSTDYEELKWAWVGFRDAVGRANKPHYIRYVELANEIAMANGHPDQGAYWRSYYEVEDLEGDAYKLYQRILPLYKQLHAYVRRKLAIYYGDEIDLKGRLPACVLGDMWGRRWGNIYRLVVPYPDTPNIDVTDEMVKQGYTPERMFNMTDEFFTSCGLIPAPQEFWDHSLIKKPTDGREVVCHPSAWDFLNAKDFRVLMCTEINMHYFLVIHHEVGHIQYTLQYKDLPLVFRGGANRGFHEAVGEVISLSVGTPKHLFEVGLLEENIEDEEIDINFLLKTALDTIGTLPFSLALEQWRYDVFAGKVDQDNWMKRWWELKETLVGVRPPVERSEEDFDPGAMFHITIDYSFLRYFLRTIIQFQFHKALCEAAGHTGPLHRCDIYRSKEAGNKLAQMLGMGKSKPWRDAMEAITGQREMSADAIMEYYAPLMEWLEKTNAENEEYIGWDGDSARPNSASAFLLVISAFAWCFCGP